MRHIKDHLPEQVKPSPVQPSLHVQVYELYVSVQSALISQAFVAFEAHSSVAIIAQYGMMRQFVAVTS